VSGGEQLEMRVGDRLPQFSAQLVDEYDVALNIVGSRAWLVLSATDSATVFGQPSPFVAECSVVDGLTGSVRYDWLQTQVDAALPGTINVSIRVQTSDVFSDYFTDEFGYNESFEVGVRRDAWITMRPRVEGGRVYLLNDAGDALLLDDITGQPMIAF